MAGSSSDIRFPLGGLSRRLGYQNPQEGVYTTPACLNVRSQDTFKERLRGGSRPGLVQVLPPKSYEIDDPPSEIPTTVEFNPTKDTRVHSDQATTNFGSAANLDFGRLSGRISRSFLHFDLGLISGGTVTSATLSLYGFSTGSAQAASVNRMTQTGWVELQATYNVYATATNWAVAGGDFTSTDAVSFTIPATATAHWLSITGMATLCNDALDNMSDQLHICIKSDDEAVSARFRANSINSGVGGFPLLSVEYTA
jgi:hypothetical protein